jgi:hypothetical protein
MKMCYIPQLIDKQTEEYNADEYMPPYSSVSRNILGPSPPPGPTPGKSQYIPRLTEEYMAICSLVNRGIY